MVNLVRPGADQGLAAPAFAVSAGAASAADKSAARTDTALFAAALFLQRFSLPFHNTALQLDLVAIGAILLYQFLRGRLVIQYDRLLWFLPLALTSTLSLVLNAKSYATAYLEFMVFQSLFTLSRPSSPDRYKRTLQAFQFLVMLLSGLGVAQFIAQFVMDSTSLLNLYGIFPESHIYRASSCDSVSQ